MAKMIQAALIAACAISGQAVTAEEHEVLILRYGYYPETIYVSAGDTIKFINESPNWARVLSNNAYDDYSNYNSSNPCANPNSYSGSQDGWATSWIPKYGSTTITVTSCMEDEIEAPSVYQYTTYNSYNEAWIVFGSAPTGG